MKILMKSLVLICCLSLQVSASGSDKIALSANASEAEKIAHAYMSAYSNVDWAAMQALAADDIRFEDTTSNAEGGAIEISGIEPLMKFLNAFSTNYGVKGLNFDFPMAFESQGVVVYTGYVNSTYPARKQGKVFRWRANQVTVITVQDGKVVKHQDFADYGHAVQGPVDIDKVYDAPKTMAK